jgi:hypothetical protein
MNKEQAIVKGGGFKKGGKPWFPCIGSKEGVIVLERSISAQKVPLSILKGSSGSFSVTHSLSLSLDCPYCGGHAGSSKKGKSAPEARERAEEALYPFNCECGAEYGKLDSSHATQTNQ